MRVLGNIKFCSRCAPLCVLLSLRASIHKYDAHEWCYEGLEREDCMIIVRCVLPILMLAVLLAGCGGSQEGQQSSQEESTIAQGGGGDATSRTVAATEAFLA